MENTNFGFDSSDASALFIKAAEYVEKHKNSPELDKESTKLIFETLIFFSRNIKSILINANWNFNLNGDEFFNILNAAGDNEEQYPLWLDMVTMELYKICIELQLSTASKLDMTLTNFIYFVETKIKNGNSLLSSQIDNIRLNMPYAIFKSVLHSEELLGFKNMNARATTLLSAIENWESTLNEKHLKIENIKKSLDQYTNEFNFVGLAKGFTNLLDIKKNQLFRLQVLTLFFGIFICVPLSAELIYLFNNRELIKISDFSLLIITIPIFSLTFIFIYFFRIIIRNADACRSQILQLELRKTLCQFIQGYSDYAGPIKKQHGDLLGKFENVVFSGIVSSDEKIPSTFDGLEQISGFVKSLNSKG